MPGPGFASTAITACPGIVDSCTSAFRSTESVRIASRRTFRGRSPGPRPARLASATSASTKVRTRRGATSSSRAGALGRWAWSAPVPRTATRRWWPGLARRLRADPDSGEPRFTRHGSLVMDWVEVFAPVVFEPYRPRRWPTGGSLLLDDLPFRVRDPRTGRHRVAFRIFCAMGYEAGRPKLWRLEAFPSKSEADWTAFLAALDGAPTRVVSDNDHGLTNAVRARFPQAELYLCEWHLRHALERLMGKLAAEAKYRDVIDELAPQVEAAFAGARSWAPFVERAHAADIPRLSEWLNTTGRIVDDQFGRRGPRATRRADTPLSTAPAELGIDDPPGGVQPFAEPRDVGGVRAFHERRPTPGPGEGRLHLRCQLVDHVPVLGLGGELSHQPLQRMPQMPLTQVQLG